jgi:hypothetical protein
MGTYMNNYGFLSAKVPEHIMSKIREEASLIQSDFSKAISANHTLAGNIKHEYDAIHLKSLLNDFLIHMANKYGESFNYLKSITVLAESVPIKVNSLWFNFQKKGEYNPLHNHTGVYSFVIWIKIPYERQKEIAHSSRIPVEVNKNGSFVFTYINILGLIASHEIQLDNTFEGNIVFFPAGLNHQVYPFFTSDEYRISLSGNICLDNTKENK